MMDPTSEPSARRRTIAIAGASGFIGRALVEALAANDDVIALARTPGEERQGVTWQSADLFNLRDAERVLAGADIAVYLVHSMMPSAALTQGRFEDLDLLCADNFARAAQKNGVGHIVYLGGLMPEAGDELSRHLESRHEVERALASRGAKVTTLRAGLVIGAGGSSFDMMAKLVGRLPFMIGPRWTRTLTQPIALEDVVSLLVYAIDHPEIAGRAYDVGGPDVVSYADMLRMTGRAQGKRTRVITLPVRTVKLSLLWVSVITGASQALVKPLVESLSHDMVASDGLTLQKMAGLVPIPLQEALARAVRGDPRDASPKPPPARAARPSPGGRITRRVCSVQRLDVKAGLTAREVAAEYGAWLPRFMRPLLRVDVDAAQTCRFYVWPISSPLLVLTLAADRSSPDRQLFYVTSGLLAGQDTGQRVAATPRPRLEFRAVLGGAQVLAAVHDFIPRLPWFVYKYTQALVHLRVMRAFARHLVAT